ncbi:hypothetical protein PIB30_009224 [Stylosanthes scabra]|uniref:Aluminum-activated malate transporter n=1 Tax=Stylosanthes scabra TaxID=79078 RepID=A0ABU6Q660_9FABA|nr:hypothetical protein [Stylosanthes scabra]
MNDRNGNGDESGSRRMIMNEKYLKKCVHAFWEKKVRKFARVAWITIWKVGSDDPRRLIHAFKVGLALTIVSLLYLLEPLFKGIGQNAIWAVMTVVVVFEFTAGATLCKGLNRGLGTLLAGLLAFLIEYVADSSGHILRAIFVGAAVFLIAQYPLLPSLKPKPFLLSLHKTPTTFTTVGSTITTIHLVDTATNTTIPKP